MSERIAIVGAGLMGHGIAQVFAGADRQVTVCDSDPVALGGLHARVRANLRDLGMDPTVADRIGVDDDLAAAVRDATVVIEAVSERLETKREVFRQLERLAPADALLATNTSVIAVGDIARDLATAGRVLGTHWWNPPYLIELVEVVQGPATRPEAVAAMRSLLAAVGKHPVHVRRDVPGFVGNRLQHALWREAIALVEAGVCDADTVDDVVTKGFGARLAEIGPMENADLVGLDLTLAIHEYLLADLDRTPGPARLLRSLVDRGDLGMRTGRGFRSWPSGAEESARERLIRHLSRRSTPTRGEETPA